MNPHALIGHQALNLARLPIPPLRRGPACSGRPITLPRRRGHPPGTVARRVSTSTTPSPLLRGYRVAEIGVWVAGPSAGGILADWGADVVKVEPPAGDPFRGLFRSLGYDPDLPAAPFALDNRGKRSVVLDLRDAEAREALERLLAESDVFLSNLRPDALARLDLDPESLTARHPRIVYASVTGYGLTGPDRDRPGYDVGAFWARTGIARQLVPPDLPPPGIRGGLGDHVTGMTAVAGILAALLERERTNKGRIVEISLHRTGLYCLGWDLGIQLSLGKVAPASPRHRNPTPLVNSYQAGDGAWFFLIGLEADRHWPGVCRAAGLAELIDDERFGNASNRIRNREALIAIFDETFATRPLSDWAERFDAEDVWWSPVLAPADVVDDPQAHAAGAFVDVDDGKGGTFRAVATPIHFHGDPLERTGPVPQLGEHTAEVLAELGYDDAGIARLTSPNSG